MLIATLFTTVKIRTQPKHLFNVGMDKKVIYIYIYTHTHAYTYIHNGILFSHEKEGNSAIWYNMDWPWGHCAKWDKSDRERQIPYDLTYEWDLKLTHKNRDQNGAY